MVKEIWRNYAGSIALEEIERHTIMIRGTGVRFGRVCWSWIVLRNLIRRISELFDLFGLGEARAGV